MLNCDAQRLHLRRRTGPAFTCRAIACACASARGGGATRPDFLASRYSHSAMARRLFNDMPNSAAYRRPRSVSCSGSRNVIALGELLAVWYHYDTCNRYSFANHRYSRSSRRLKPQGFVGSKNWNATVYWNPRVVGPPGQRVAADARRQFRANSCPRDSQND